MVSSGSTARLRVAALRLGLSTVTALVLAGCRPDQPAVDLASGTTSGVRVHVAGDGSVVAGRRATITVTVANGTGRPIYVPDGSCDGTAHVSAALAVPTGAGGRDPVSRVRRKALLERPGSTTLDVVPRRDCEFEQVESVRQLAPGEQVTERFVWTGYLVAGAVRGDGGYQDVRPSGVLELTAGVVFATSKVTAVNQLARTADATWRGGVDGGEAYVAPDAALDTALGDPRVAAWIARNCATDCNVSFAAGRRTWNLDLSLDGKGAASLYADVDVTTGALRDVVAR